MSSAAEALVLARRESVPSTDPHRGAGFRGQSPAGRVVAEWHDGEHGGAFTTCQEQPCLAVKAVDR